MDNFKMFSDNTKYYIFSNNILYDSNTIQYLSKDHNKFMSIFQKIKIPEYIENNIKEISITDREKYYLTILTNSGDMYIQNENNVFEKISFSDKVKKCHDGIVILENNDVYLKGEYYKSELGIKTGIYNDTSQINYSNYTKSELYSGQNIKDLIISKSNSLLLLNDGTILSNSSKDDFSYNNISSELYYCEDKLRKLDNISNIKSIKDFDMVQMLQTNDNKLYTRGANLSINWTYSKFTSMNLNKDVNKYYCDGRNIIILFNDNTMYKLGDDNNSIFGYSELHGTITEHDFGLPENEKVIDLYYKSSHLFLICKSGNIYFKGYNDMCFTTGELHKYIKSATKIQEFFQPIPMNINNICINYLDKQNKIIDCGNKHVLLIKNDNLYTCGDNSCGQLGLGDNINRKVFTKTNKSQIKSFSTGYNHSAIVTNDGRLFMCGDNSCGQLGLGDTQSKNTFTEVNNISNVKEVKCGDRYTIIVLDNNDILSCGLNDKGQLCLNDMINKNIFTKINDIS